MPTTAPRPSHTNESLLEPSSVPVSEAVRKIRVERRFSKPGDPFAGIKWSLRSSKIANPDGSVVFEMENVEVPDTWDQVAVDILASKYFRKAGVPQVDAQGAPVLDDSGVQVTGPERSMKQVALRMANAWRLWGERGGYFASNEDAEAFRDELAYMLVTQMAAPNSPQWFNTGLFEAYGIVEDPEGNWYVDPASGETMLSAHKHERSAANACFIMHVEDTLVGESSIMRHIEDAARLFKAGSGVGANYSTIRERGGKLTAGGSSSGLMSFLRVHDRAAGAIKSGGTTRRAAKMVIVDADHPDIEEFIWAKVQEEKKVAALIAAGYSSDYNGEAYDTVSYQNANHSVRIPQGFMERLAANGEWNLTARRDGSVVSSMPAKKLWDDIAAAAWQCADPGLQFDDLLNDWNTVADTERVHGTNPCSEYTHVDNTACNLASLNLVSFYDDATATFRPEDFQHAVRLWTIVLEITVSMSHYPTEIVARRSFEHRTLGLGYANLGALLMRAGLPYDSDLARAATSVITALMHDTAYATSAELAAAVGPCEAFGPNRNSALRVLRNHRRATYGSLAQQDPFEQLNVIPQVLDHLVLAHTPFSNLSAPALAAADAMVATAERDGLRNMQVTVLAPTGTIGLVMGCDTTGVEPDFALVKLKKLAGGGYMQIINQSVEPALRRLGYADDAIASIKAHMLGTKTLDGDTPINTATLLAAGLTDAEVTAAAWAIPSMSDVTWAFGAFTVGEDVYARFGVDPAAGGAALLAAAGFSPDQITVSSKTICGHLTVEGAPDLRLEHLPVFDCAVECGDGTRVIHWSGHVRALSAVAPHLSGAASKTINLPNSADVAEVAAAHELAYRLAVKCVAIYRDGSKLSQPLNSAKSSEAGEGVDDELSEHRLRFGEIPAGISPTAFYNGNTPHRFKLPSARHGITWRFEIGGEEVYMRSGEYADGSLGELFLDWGKPGSTLRGMTSALSIAISQALQHGVPLDRFVRALRGHNFEPRGMVTGNDHLKMADSLMDAVVRILGHHYLGDESLVQVKSAPAAATATADTSQARGSEDNASRQELSPRAAEPQADAVMPARVFGKKCSNCGSDKLTKSGSCEVCLDCGTTTGCS